jgi:cell volume regulation protein A
MQETPAIQTAIHVLYVVGIILGCGSIAGFIAKKIRVPDIVIFLLAGILLGPEVGSVINVPAASALTQVIFIFGAAYIIFDGGVTVSLKVLKSVWISLVVIATIGVVITMIIVGYTSHWVFGIPLLGAMLLGAVIASTDPATLVPIFQQVTIRDRVSHLVMSESALNDAMGAIVTIVMVGLVTGGTLSIGHSLGNFFWEAGIGIVIGIVIGGLAIFFIAHEKFNFLQDYTPPITIIVVVGGYLVGELVGASGYMSAFIAGLIFGNKELVGFKMKPEQEKGMEHFIETTSLIMRMFIFILLGSQVNFQLLSAHWVGGLIVIGVFMFIARPVTVFICCPPDRRAKWELKELLFISWVRETGVIPSALAVLLLGMHAPHAQLIASVTFMAVIITILLQATTTKWWGEKLGLLVEEPPKEPLDVGHPAGPE